MSAFIHPPDEDFLGRFVARNPWLGARQALLARWLDDPTDREEIAARLAVPLGRLLYSFNDTAPLQEPVRFGYRRTGYAVVGMAGVCDDIVGGRFPRFGSPVTLRCFLDPPGLLPRGMLEAADWNFMDAGRDGFLGYCYGVRHGDTLYLAGLQSDLAARYAYLFQAHGGRTHVRVGEEVVHGDTTVLAARWGSHVPLLRRTFQRYWIDVLLAGVLAWSVQDGGLDAVGVLRFPLTEAEGRSGHLVHRVYRDLPDRLGCSPRTVVVGARRHPYQVARLEQVADYLGDRFAAVTLGPTSSPIGTRPVA